MEALWVALMAGGWFLGEMTFMLWVMLMGIIFVPLGIIAYMTELPEEDSEETMAGARMVGSIVLFGVMLFLLNWGGLPLWTLVKAHALEVGISAIAFVAIGVMWSLWKFRLFAQRCKAEIMRVVESFCRDKKLDAKAVLTEVDGKPQLTLEKKHAEDWERHFRSNRGGRLASSGATAESPEVTFARNKERITLWILFWPASALRGLFSDLLAQALDMLIMSMQGIYKKIAEREAVKVNFTDPDPSDETAAKDAGDTVQSFGRRRSGHNEG
ncbi:MAG: hypothetical protein A3C93_05185 [Candidatus Lloydbacteria bacterium RIFCSPHIGHO2_02_FULL_54_17]|uniref:Uncharacterized protein n=1 Tax=Candidatus Lloydbacteria bacterium RIFCSPHIGHO2_02_FULL_54_17 TaxID=1798664 RepID=A0A1G2DCG3_9BACT|nr:MAG: hypothetical protein A2762_05860 [Candidatus Lloydbacteria bacterium RIFCSPHIGHO2_01_FULL_54_11]OGZ11306.1 MAG: hypothetical protein A3C93_05185 [Candidatus Lloydbacteria bacterium RIFCSPHIGHO2_02_FULL_54_17]OGZ13794.1 MAG: hypothetical protein A2948_03820 [Candidatus Lloydbacteria bacterium RIFCSPLOWO2_01_FULL_54_18]